MYHKIIIIGSAAAILLLDALPATLLVVMHIVPLVPALMGGGVLLLGILVGVMKLLPLTTTPSPPRKRGPIQEHAMRFFLEQPSWHFLTGQEQLEPPTSTCTTSPDLVSGPVQKNAQRHPTEKASSIPSTPSPVPALDLSSLMTTISLPASPNRPKEDPDSARSTRTMSTCPPSTELRPRALATPTATTPPLSPTHPVASHLTFDTPSPTQALTQSDEEKPLLDPQPDIWDSVDTLFQAALTYVNYTGYTHDELSLWETLLSTLEQATIREFCAWAGQWNREVTSAWTALLRGNPAYLPQADIDLSHTPSPTHDFCPKHEKALDHIATAPSSYWPKSWPHREWPKDWEEQAAECWTDLCIREYKLMETGDFNLNVLVYTINQLTQETGDQDLSAPTAPM